MTENTPALIFCAELVYLQQYEKAVGLFLGLQWKTGIIHNLFKGKGTKKTSQKYRSITLLLVFRKIFTKIMTDWAEIHDKIPPFQGITALILDELVQKAIGRSNCKLYVAFEDFKTALEPG